MVRNEDERAQALRAMGAEVVVGNLLDLGSMHRVIAATRRCDFGMSVSDDYLSATVNTGAVAKHHCVKAFINMSEMTLSQISMTQTTASPQHKLHWLAEQAGHSRRAVARDGLFEHGLPVHLVNHLVAMADLHRAGPTAACRTTSSR